MAQGWGGAWVAQLVKCPTLDFGSGHDLRVHEIEPCIGLCTDSPQPVFLFLSLSVSLSSLRLSPPVLSLKINNIKIKN